MKGRVNVETGEIVLAGVRPRLRAAYDDHGPMSDETGLACLDESLADQSSREEADINTLVRRFGIGELPVRDVRAPWYGDFTGLKSPHEMAQALVEAQAVFMQMPAKVRAEFDNDPHRFVDFCSKDENYDRMCDMGLLAPEPMQKRLEARKAKERADFEAKAREFAEAEAKKAKPPAQ